MAALGLRGAARRRLEAIGEAAQDADGAAADRGSGRDRLGLRRAWGGGELALGEVSRDACVDEVEHGLAPFGRVQLGTGPLEARTTRWVGSRTSSPPSVRRRTASSPLAAWGWKTVVSFAAAAAAMSS
jgi:hypothetical protein